MMRIFLLCVAMASMSALMAQGASQSKSTSQLFGEATDLFRKEKFAVAQHFFDRYIKCSDASADEIEEALYYSAVCSE